MSFFFIFASTRIFGYESSFYYINEYIPDERNHRLVEFFWEKQQQNIISENISEYAENRDAIFLQIGLIGLNCLVNGCNNNFLPWQFFAKTPDIILQNIIGVKLFSYFNDYTLPKEDNIVYGDFHVHTVFSHDSVTDFEDLVRNAYKKGIRILAITEHDMFSFNYYKKKLDRLKAKGIIGKDFILIPGEEVSSAGGHIVALFIKKRIERGLSVQETISEIHKQGGVAILPHLTLYSTGVGWDIAKQATADGVEIRNGANFLPWNFFIDNGFNGKWFYSSTFGDSDSHLSSAVGLFLTKIRIDKENFDENDVKKAIIDGRVKPYIPDNVYRRYPFYVSMLKWYFFPFMLYYNVKSVFQSVLSELLAGNVKFWLNYDPVVYDFANIVFIPRAVKGIINGEYGGGLKIMRFEWSRGPFVFSWNRTVKGYYLKFDFKREF